MPSSPPAAGGLPRCWPPAGRAARPATRSRGRARPGPPLAHHASRCGTGRAGLQGAHVARVNERFTSEHPQLRVELLTVPESELTVKLATALAAGSPPDLAFLGASRLAEQIEHKRVVSLRRYRRDLARLDWYDAPGRVLVRGEDVFAMPVQTGTLALYYNADLYQRAGLDPNAPPATWAALLANARAIARPEQERWGHAIGTTPIAWTAEQQWVAYLWQAGGEWLTPDGRQAAFNAAAGVEALEFWADLVQKHQVAPRKAIDNLVMAGEFEAGTVGHMTIYPSWALRAEGMRFPVRTAPLPRHRRPATVASVVAIPLFSESTQQDAAWTYLDWLSQPDHLIFYLSGLGGIPPRVTVAELAAWRAFVAQHPLLQAFVDGLPEARVAYVGDGRPGHRRPGGPGDRGRRLRPEVAQAGARRRRPAGRRHPGAGVGRSAARSRVPIQNQPPGSRTMPGGACGAARSGAGRGESGMSGLLHRTRESRASAPRQTPSLGRCRSSTAQRRDVSHVGNRPAGDA